MYTVVHLHILTTDGSMQPPYLEYLQIASSVNLWFERHFVSQKFYYCTTILFMRGDNLCLLNTKKLNALLFHKISDPLCRCSLFVGTLPMRKELGMIYFLLHANNSILNLYTLYSTLFDFEIDFDNVNLNNKKYICRLPYNTHLKSTIQRDTKFLQVRRCIFLM